MATFGWSYKSNVCGAKRPKEQGRKVEGWQKTREDAKVPLHAQTHSAESLNAGMKRRRYNPRAKIYIGNLSKDTKAVTLAEYFSFFGEIAYMKLMKDRETGMSRGFAFITFVEVETAAKATRWCQHNHPRIDDRQIKVGLAERRRRQDMSHNQQGVPLTNDTKGERRDTHTLYWEYKWSEDLDAEVFGPYETSLMLQWSMADYFRVGCWVRQAVRSHTEPDRTDDESKELTSNESQHQATSLVGSYSSSSEDEGSESETEVKRAKLEYLEHEHGDTTKVDGDEKEASHRPLVELSSTDLNEESSQSRKNNKLKTNFNQNVDDKYIECNSEALTNASKEDSIEKKTKNIEIASQEVLQQDHINTSWQIDSPDSDDGDKHVQDPTSSWYQADRGGYKTRDLLGRDSSSEDEEFDYYDMDLQTVESENEFVHISEIDFSMFP